MGSRSDNVFASPFSQKGKVKMGVLFGQWYMEWYFFVIMALLLIGLIGLLLYLRKKGEED
jgi:hypothetical protein